MYLSDSCLLGFNFIIVPSMTILVFLYAFYNVLHPRRDLNDFLVLLFFVCVMIAFRTRGWDVEQYYNAYSSISGETLDFNSWFEPGFLLFNFIFKYIGAPYFVFNAVISVFIVILVFFAAKYNAINVYVFLFLFFLFYFFRGPYGQVRQALSTLAFMISVKYLLPEKRCLFKYFFINAVAFTFHTVSIASIIVPFVSSVWISRRFICWLCLLFITVLFSFMMLPSNVGVLLSHLGGVPYLDKIYVYVTSFPASGDIFNPDATRIIFCFLIMIFGSEGFYDKRSSFARINNMHRVIFIIGALLYAFLSFDFRMASRIASYFYVFDIFIYTSCILSVRRSFNRIFLFFIITVVGFVYYMYEFYMMNIGEIKYQWGF